MTGKQQTRENHARPLTLLQTALLFCGLGVTGVALFLLALGADSGDENTQERVFSSETNAQRNETTTKRQVNQQRPTGNPVDITWVGDLMIGSSTPSPLLPPDGGSRMFDNVKHLLKADILAGNLEGPLTDSGPNKCRRKQRSTKEKCFVFSQPPEYAKIYKQAGFSLLNLANNHAHDRGDIGIEQTIEALDNVGISHTGLPNNAPIIERNGTTTVFLGFSHYPATNPIHDLAKVADQIRKADEKADLVVVLFHGGTEGPEGSHIKGVRDPGTDFIRFAHRAVDAGADLVLGSGPHVLRGIEVYQERLIAYSLGNFATYRQFNLFGVLGKSGVLQVRLAPDGTFLQGKFSPVELLDFGVPIPGGPGTTIIRSLSQEDFSNKAAVIDKSGNISLPSLGKEKSNQHSLQKVERNRNSTAENADGTSAPSGKTDSEAESSASHTNPQKTLPAGRPQTRKVPDKQGTPTSTSPTSTSTPPKKFTLNQLIHKILHQIEHLQTRF